MDELRHLFLTSEIRRGQPDFMFYLRMAKSTV